MKFFLKKETKNWPHQIINFLYEHYGESYTELNNFLYSRLNFSNNNTTHKDNIKKLLIDLEAEGYVTWKVILMEDDYKTWKEDNYQEKFQTLPHLTLKNHRVEARLTIKGLDYSIQLRREKQKHEMYLVSTPVTTLFAVLAALMATFTFIRGCKKPEPKTSQSKLYMPPQIEKKTVYTMRYPSQHREQLQQKNVKG